MYSILQKKNPETDWLTEEVGLYIATPQRGRLVDAELLGNPRCFCGNLRSGVVSITSSNAVLFGKRFYSQLPISRIRAADITNSN